MPNYNEGNEWEQDYSAWGEEAWGDLGSDALLEGEGVDIPDNVAFPAHFTAVSSSPLVPRGEKDPFKAPVMLVSWTVNIHVSDDVDVKRTLRDVWVKAPFTDPDGKKHPADLRELMRVCLQALGGQAPRNSYGKPVLDAEHGPEWWSEAVIGYPIRVKATKREYTRQDGTKGSTQDFRVAGAWLEGEILS